MWGHKSAFPRFSTLPTLLPPPSLLFLAPTYKYFEFKYAANLAIYDAFKQQGIEIPFPQREVNLTNQ